MDFVTFDGAFRAFGTRSISADVITNAYLCPSFPQLRASCVDF